MFNNLTMRMKIMLPVCVAVTAVFLAAILLIGIKLRENSHRDMLAAGEEMSLRYGAAVGRDLDAAMAVSRTMAEMIGAAAESGTADRKAVIGMLAEVLKANPGLYGVWSCFEPDAFDGGDGRHVEADKFHDKTGRFVPYWYREGGGITGGPVVAYAEPAPLSDWYTVPLKSGRPHITPPTAYTVGGREVLLVSICVPISVKGKVVGVAGVDMDLGKLTEMVSGIKAFETGYGSLLSDDGMIVAHPRKELIGKRIDAYVAEGERAAFLDAVRKGRKHVLHQVSSATGELQLYVMTPVRIMDSDTAWSFSITLPEKKITENADALLRLLVILGVAGVLLSVGAVYRIAKAIVRPVNTLVDAAAAVAGGDLEHRIDVDQRDEIGRLAEAFRKMVAGLKGMIETANQKTAEAEEQSARAVRAMAEAEEARARADLARSEGLLQAAQRLEVVVERLASATEEMSSQSEELLRGSDEQSERIQTTATAMEEMNSTVLEIARNAGEAAKAGKAAQEGAKEGAAVVSRARETMHSTINEVDLLKGNMRELDNQAQGIGAIIGVINDIADQTNLLALNAAIEAARAGEAGRGFAVVADEVRKLAEKTMTATKEVSGSIGAIQKVAGANIAAMEEVFKRISEAGEFSSRSGGMLNEIVAQTEASAAQITGIATAAEQQSSTSEEINRAIEDVNRITMEASRGVKELTLALKSIAEQAADLKSVVEDLKEEGGEGGVKALGPGR